MVGISSLNKRELHNLKVWFAEQVSDEQPDNVQDKIYDVTDAISKLIHEMEV